MKFPVINLSQLEQRLKIPTGKLVEYTNTLFSFEDKTWNITYNPDADLATGWENFAISESRFTVRSGEGRAVMAVTRNLLKKIELFKRSQVVLADKGLDKTYNYPRPPYAGAWDASDCFCRDIGHYSCSGYVDGLFTPVDVNDQFAGFKAISPVQIIAKGGSNRSETIIPIGGIWLRSNQVINITKIETVLDTEYHPQNLVDSLGRW